MAIARYIGSSSDKRIGLIHAGYNGKWRLPGPAISDAARMGQRGLPGRNPRLQPQIWSRGQGWLEKYRR
jgi:hypothetical protein